MVFLFRAALVSKKIPSGLLLSVFAFAGAIAVYTGHLAGPWLKSFTWLFNGILVVAFGLFLIFDGRQFFTNEPFRFAIMVLLLAASLLNSIALYPKSPKPPAKIESPG